MQVAREPLVLLARAKTCYAPALVVGIERKLESDRILQPAQEAHAGVGLFLHELFSRFSVRQYHCN
jgi:hypothetical protein